jgi:hypothetical protein
MICTEFFTVPDNLKKDYDMFVENKYGFKKSKCGKEIENLIKLQLAVDGNEKYTNDPDVQKLRDTISQKSAHITVHRR